MVSDRVDINRVLLEMRSLKAQTQTSQVQPGTDIQQPGKTSLGIGGIQETNASPGFSQVLEQAVNKVNSVQKASGAVATAFEQGQPGVDITDVMIASQKANVSFQAMVQVRNKLVEAYRDVMNMPV